MARKVILYIATSIDGYIADEYGNIDWLDSVNLYEEDNSYENFIKAIDTVILGRNTYDQVTQELSPDYYPYEGQTSYIITNRLEENKENIIFTSEDIVKLIENLKSKSGKDIWIVGGASIIEPLVRENIIDEYQICTIPIILGKGIKLFKEFPNPVYLNTESVYVKNDMIYSKYSKR